MVRPGPGWSNPTPDRGVHLLRTLSPSHHINRGTGLSHSRTDAERSHCLCSGPSAAESSRWPTVPFCVKKAWHFLNDASRLEGTEIRAWIHRACFSSAFTFLYDKWAGQMVLAASTSITCAHIKDLIHLQSRGRSHPTIKKYVLHVK